MDEIGPPIAAAPRVRYVLVHRTVAVPPAPSYDDLPTAVAALDQARRENPHVPPESIVLMAAAVESADVGVSPQADQEMPEPVEIRVMELEAPDPPAPEPTP